jgi:hypothetical protein
MEIPLIRVKQEVCHNAIQGHDSYRVERYSVTEELDIFLQRRWREGWSIS